MDLIPPASNDLQNHVAGILQDIGSLHKAISVRYQAIGRKVWGSPFTPPDVVAALGTKAGAIFQLSGALAGILVAAKPSEPVEVMPEGYTAAINEDGTVTVTPPPAVEPEIVPEN